MIKAEFFSAGEREASSGFRVSGHTGVSGQSVVCAAVSSACYMAAKTITEILGAEADVSESDGYMSVVVKGDDVPRADAILAGLRLHLEQLAMQYPKQIKIIISEVHQ